MRSGEGSGIQIIIHGYYGGGNTGDEAILRAMTEQFAEAFPGCRIGVLVQGQHPIYPAVHVETILASDRRTVIRSIQQSDVVILGGGGLLQDYYGVRLSDLLGGPRPGMNYYAGPIFLGRVLGKPSMLYAVGVGPLLTERGANYAGWIAETASAVTVRDPQSAETLRGICGVTSTVTADPALSLKPASERWVREFLARKGIPMKRQLVGITLRDWFFAQGGRHKLADRIARLADVLISEGAHILLLPFSTSPQDHALSRLIRQLSRRPKGISILTCIAPHHLKAIVGTLSLMIAMRLHAAVFSSSMGVPTIAIAYDPKVSNYMSLLKMGTCCFPLEGGLRRIGYTALSLLDGGSSIRQTLLESTNRLKELERQNVQRLAALMGGSHSKVTEDVLGEQPPL